MIKLSEISTRPPEDYNKSETKEKTKDLAKRIGELQEMMYAEGKHALLVIFQGMDSSGKDGSTRAAFERCSPAGVHFRPFKKPTEEEFAHDFLWRAHKVAPAKGEIAIFNRSHYEDILIQRVHGWITEDHVAKRMQAINSFEELLQWDNNTTILKFYMHLSYERQEEKLQERIDDPNKNWKHNPGDWEERKRWKDYRKAYEYAINNSTVPWHIIPVDSRSYRNYCITKIICDTMENLNFQLPVLGMNETK